ncbi:MAG: glycosyltransferase [Actinomycetia bacterium]|nr:glycosyltransferase [Actinomycetes bacterium]
MSTILFYTSPARGHLNPMMDVAVALRSMGHRVVMQTLTSEVDLVERAGLEHRPISTDTASLALADYKGSNPLKQLQITGACWQERASHEVTDLREVVAELDPDLLVVDANSWGAAAFAEGQSRPWAMFLPYCLPAPSPDVPAFGPGFPPPKNRLDRIRDRVVWSLSKRATRNSIKKLNALRAKLGVAALDSYADVYDRADLLLYRTAEPFDYPRRDWPESIRAIGPGLWTEPETAPEWIGDLPHPRVLVSVSTEFQDDGAIIDTALAALADQPGSVIVTTAALDPSRFHAPNDRVRITRHLPHAAVLAEVDVLVTHGGMGTTQRALAAGVPVCVIPWGRDQNETARRVRECGAGTMVPRSKLSATRVRKGVSDALAMTPGAEQLAAAFGSAGGGARGAELLEGLLGEAIVAPTPTSPTGALRPAAPK